VRALVYHGHEAVGTVDEAGDNVHRLSPGDRVLVSCISGCGSCQFCRSFGADVTVNDSREDPMAVIKDLTG